MKDYAFHEIANIFPMMSEEEFSGTVANIRKEGQLDDIELFEGKILDGRNRYRACLEAGIEPRFVDVSPNDPVGYVVSKNLHRRHLQPSQIAMVGDKVREVFDLRAKERQAEGRTEGGRTAGRGRAKDGDSLPVMLPASKRSDARDEAGKAVGVSGSLIDRARKVREKGVPELAKAVEEGRMSVTAAAKLTKEDPEIQREEANAATFSGGRYRRRTSPDAPKPPKEPEPEEGKLRGVGVFKAQEAINCLKHIPKNDALRKRGFEIVVDWIKNNR